MIFSVTIIKKKKKQKMKLSNNRIESSINIIPRDIFFILKSKILSDISRTLEF